MSQRTIDSSTAYYFQCREFSLSGHRSTIACGSKNLADTAGNQPRCQAYAASHNNIRP